MHWTTWESLCVSKFKGGLGFRDLETFNQALLAKQGWRILSKTDSMLALALKRKYFFDCNFYDASARNQDSFILKSLFGGSNFSRWRVGNGEQILISRDKWLLTPSSFTTMFPFRGEAGRSVASLVSLDGEWKRQEILA